jgi:hypothetical protein
LGDYEAARASMRIALEKYPNDLTPDERSQAEKLLRSPSP